MIDKSLLLCYNYINIAKKGGNSTVSRCNIARGDTMTVMTLKEGIRFVVVVACLVWLVGVMNAPVASFNKDLQAEAYKAYAYGELRGVVAGMLATLLLVTYVWLEIRWEKSARSRAAERIRKEKRFERFCRQVPDGRGNYRT